jgi:hypothetical protein
VALPSIVFDEAGSEGIHSVSHTKFDRTQDWDWREASCGFTRLYCQWQG